MAFQRGEREKGTRSKSVRQRDRESVIVECQTGAYPPKKIGQGTKRKSILGEDCALLLPSFSLLMGIHTLNSCIHISVIIYNVSCTTQRMRTHKLFSSQQLQENSNF